jgi:hypothetical protein
MFRRLSAAGLLCAWLCASGAMLDVAQVIAWARMFGAYARTESLTVAAKETFDPAKPCGICLAVGRARAAADGRVPPVASASAEKLVLIFERCAPFVAWAAPQSWPRVAPSRAPACVAEVPVPPPRGPEPIELS